MATFNEKMYDNAVYRFVSLTSKYGREKGIQMMVAGINRYTNVRRLAATEQVAKDIGEVAIAKYVRNRILNIS